MGEGFQFIDLILFAMIAAFLILRLRSVLGRHRDSGRSDKPVELDSHFSGTEHTGNVLTDPDPKPEANIDDKAKVDPETESPLQSGFEEIKKLSPDFSKAEFLTGVRGAFEIVVQAFSEGDRKQLEALLSQEVFSNFAAAIASREKDEQILENTLIRIVDAVPIEAYMADTTSHVTVKIISEQIKVTRNRDGEVIDGSPDHVFEITDIWTFARDTNSQDPNWELVATRSLD